MPYQFKRAPLRQDEAISLARVWKKHEQKLVGWTLLSRTTLQRMIKRGMGVPAIERIVKRVENSGCHKADVSLILED